MTGDSPDVYPIGQKMERLVTALYRALRERSRRLKPETRVAEDVFADIQRRKGWGGTESVSGTGSDFDQVRALVSKLPGVFRDLQVETVLDVPCGDFHWMRTVDLSGIRYIGADIVTDLVRSNQSRYGTGRIEFTRLDIVRDRAPCVDLIFCRDCLVHLSFEEVFRALKNVCASGSTYLLTTTFPARSRNSDIQTGQWRPLNFVAQPFSLPEPILLLDEKCTENDGAYADKSLGLWRVEDLRDPVFIGSRTTRRASWT
ncbi:MAG: class I SAM-dependent methyltransferase [Vicinamibacterales bacterium]